jgi:hypothetical protein
MKDFKKNPKLPKVIEDINSVLKKHSLSGKVEMSSISFISPERLGVNCRRVQRTREVRIPGTNRTRTIVYFETVCD